MSDRIQDGAETRGPSRIVRPVRSDIVYGPGSSTDRAIVTWNGTTGILLRDNPGSTIESDGVVYLTTTTNAFGRLLQLAKADYSLAANNLTPLDVQVAATTVGANYLYGISSSARIAAAGAQSADIVGGYFQGRIDNVGALLSGDLVGVYGEGQANAIAETVAMICGGKFLANLASAATPELLVGVLVEGCIVGDGSVVDLCGIMVRAPTVDGGTPVHCYGIYIVPPTIGIAVNEAIHFEGAAIVKGSDAVTLEATTDLDLTAAGQINLNSDAYVTGLADITGVLTANGGIDSYDSITVYSSTSPPGCLLALLNGTYDASAAEQYALLVSVALTTAGVNTFRAARIVAKVAHATGVQTLAEGANIVVGTLIGTADTTTMRALSLETIPSHSIDMTLLEGLNIKCHSTTTLNSVTTSRALHIETLNAGAGSVYNVYGIDIAGIDQGTVNSTSCGIVVRAATGGTIADAFGIYLEELTIGTNIHAIWMAGANGIHFRESTNKIYSSGGGNLDIETDGGNINLTSGNVVVSHQLDVGAALTVVGDVQLTTGGEITTTAGGDLSLTPNAAGDLILDGQKWPQALGNANDILTTDAAGQTSWAAAHSLLPTKDKTHRLTFQIGSATGDDLDVPKDPFLVVNLPFACTVTEVFCQTDVAGSTYTFFISERAKASMFTAAGESFIRTNGFQATDAGQSYPTAGAFNDTAIAADSWLVLATDSVGATKPKQMGGYINLTID